MSAPSHFKIENIHNYEDLLKHFVSPGAFHNLSKIIGFRISQNYSITGEDAYWVSLHAKREGDGITRRVIFVDCSTCFCETKKLADKCVLKIKNILKKNNVDFEYSGLKIHNISKKTYKPLSQPGKLKDFVTQTIRNITNGIDMAGISHCDDPIQYVEFDLSIKTIKDSETGEDIYVLAHSDIDKCANRIKFSVPLIFDSK